MIARVIVPKLRHALIGVAALAWIPDADAVAEDRDARARRWATTDLACAKPGAPVPSCGDQHAPARMSSGGDLVNGYVTRALAATAAARSSLPASAPGKRPSQKASGTLPAAPVKIDDYLPMAHALREAVGALGRNVGAEVTLAFVDRPITAADDGERLARVRAMPATFPFIALLPFSASLSGIYRSDGARFDHVLFHAIDPERLIAWNVVRPESAPERAGHAPARPSLGDLGAIPPLSGAPLGMKPPLWGVPAAGTERKFGEPDDGNVKKRRTIIYMEKGRTVVMTVEDPPSK